MSLSQILSEALIRELDAAYYGCEWHCMSKDEIAEMLDSDLEKGMTMAVASEKMETQGPNFIPSPQPCPQWMCCLLPWLKNTASMRSYNRCIAESAQTIRSGRCLCIDSFSVVRGDIVYVEQGDVIPADCRIISCSKDLTLYAFDFEDSKLHSEDVTATSRQSFLESTNILYAGSLVVSGQAKGIVVNIGKDTVMAEIIERRAWPITNQNTDTHRLLPPV
mmetsp:Transcript_17269/g.26961  ORF Transcript_17269/g.26961 Transcript_17269/m.26961 type:complete len:220 (+) Transcript_17269:179-838(+)